MTSYQSDISSIDKGFLIEMLQSSLYSKPLKSIVRELLNNARDANIENGVDPTKIEITSYDSANGYWRIQDYGKGMPPEFIDKVYRLFGASTKRDSLNQAGSFGLGAKSPWSVVSKFYVETRCGDRYYKYECSTPSPGIDNIKLIEQRANSEGYTGTIITLYKTDLKQSSYCFIYELNQAVKEYTQFWEYNPPRVEWLIKSDRWGIVIDPECTGQNRCLVNKVPYKISWGCSKATISKEATFIYIANKNNVHCTPSREELVYDEHTNSFLKEVEEDYKANIDSLIRKQLNEWDNIHDALIWFYKLAHFYLLDFNEDYFYRGYLIDKTKIEFSKEERCRVIVKDFNNDKRGSYSSNEYTNILPGKDINKEIYLLDIPSSKIAELGKRLKSSHVIITNPKAFLKDTLLSQLRYSYASSLIPIKEKVTSPKTNSDDVEVTVKYLAGELKGSDKYGWVGLPYNYGYEIRRKDLSEEVIFIMADPGDNITSAYQTILNLNSRLDYALLRKMQDKWGISVLVLNNTNLSKIKVKKKVTHVSNLISSHLEGCSIPLEQLKFLGCMFIEATHSIYNVKYDNYPGNNIEERRKIYRRLVRILVHSSLISINTSWSNKVKLIKEHQKTHASNLFSIELALTTVEIDDWYSLEEWVHEYLVQGLEKYKHLEYLLALGAKNEVILDYIYLTDQA